MGNHFLCLPAGFLLTFASACGGSDGDASGTGGGSASGGNSGTSSGGNAGTSPGTGGTAAGGGSSSGGAAGAGPCMSSEDCAPDHFCFEGACHEDVVDVAAGATDVCAVLASGRVACFGGTEDLVGLPSLTDGPYEHAVVLVAGLNDAAAIQVGYEHACAITRDGAVMCWGNAEGGQIGNGTTARRGYPDPARVATGAGALPPVSLLSTAMHASCTAAEGGLYCWGNNSNAWLTGSFASDTIARATELRTPGPRLLSLGDRFVVTIEQSGEICRWGRNTNQQIVPEPVGVDQWILEAVCDPSPADVVELGAGRAHVCARLANGAVQCWGGGSEGQLGLGEITADAAPFGATIPDLVAIDLAVGDEHACGLLEGGREVYCWGSNYHGQLGTSFPSLGNSDSWRGTLSPVQLVLAEGITITAIEAGPYARDTCAILSDGSLTCWGGATAGIYDSFGISARPYAVPPTW